MGKIIDIMESDGNSFKVIEAGESANITGSCTELDNTTVIALASLVSFQVTIFEEETGTVINSRNEQDIKNANGGVIADPATFVFYMDPEDNAIANGQTEAGKKENHIIRFKWTWDDGTHPTDREGFANYRIRVRKLKTPQPS